MKTKIVVKGYGDVEWYERAFEPQDSPDGKGVPRYVPAHRAHGWNGSANDWDEPEAVYLKNSGHHPKRGKLPMIRAIPEIYVQELDELDAKRDALRAEITRLNREEQAILKNAFPVGKALDLSTVKGWAEEKAKQSKNGA